MSEHLEKVATLTGHTDRVWGCDWRHDGCVLATCSADKTVRLWNIDSSGKAGPVRAPCAAVLNSDTHDRTIRTVQFSLDGSTIAAASFDGRTSLWRREEQDLDAAPDEAAGWRCMTKLEGHENEVKCAVWSPSGESIATCGRDKTVWLYERVEGEGQGGKEPSWECAAILTGHTQDVKCVRWHPEGEFLLSASYDDTIKMWGKVTDDWGLLHTLRGHTSTVWGIAFNHDGSHFASCSDDRTVRIWTRLPPRRPPAAAPQQQTLPDGKGKLPPWYLSGVFRSAVTSSSHTEQLDQYLQQQQQQQPSEQEPQEQQEQANGVLGEEERVEMDVSGWRCSCTLQGYHGRTIYCVDWSKQGDDCIATACGDNALRVFKKASPDATEWTLSCMQPDAHGTDVNTVMWRPHREEDGSLLLATGGDDGMVHLWRYVPAADAGTAAAATE
ncbi:unnamed protein product [Vitrella brassicaformis CCMP3155]|uniref:Probable cytosolic iron-sulfur protein assembly protein CIAO1 homolog n=1 Tax=Vitrella brassicaformis (strain CCMP3155) TaxID=1169540 RepID=A0A0G4GQT9_VITBC|nr:unnamed protein product [Vitrella brassicaformis CCMP3155]|eukprot:CEM32669.1 unnamed protein product [Vitrella brassicaformis CCMP3155]